jgi:hypothetical protein
MRLESISKPFNAGRDVELLFNLSPCHGVHGGELRMRISPEAAKMYLVGDEKSIRIRSI